MVIAPTINATGQDVLKLKSAWREGTTHFVMGVKNAMPVDKDALNFYVQTLRRLAPTATFTGAGIWRDALTATAKRLRARASRPHHLQLQPVLF